MRIILIKENHLINYLALYKAWYDYKKSKRKTFQLDLFAYNLENNLTRLHRDIVDGKYYHSNYNEILIKDKKSRKIFIASVRDKVVHRLIYENLVALCDKALDPDVYSSRKDKGLVKALTRSKFLLTKYHNGFVWRADIVKFFDNVSHSVLLNVLKLKIADDA